MIGRKISDRYLIVELLGSGSFGDTYLAKDTQMPEECFCVVKHLQPKLKNLDESLLKRCREDFFKEAKTLQRLGDHLQIPELLAYLEEENQFYLVQEYIEGDNLNAEIKQGEKLSEEETKKLLIEILEVLDFIQSQNIIHRDIKPANLMRCKTNNKIIFIDFGAVKEIGLQMSNPNQQNPTVVIGSEGYMPSEQLAGNPCLASDIYAVGAIAIQALTGKQPKDLSKDQNSQFIWRDKANVSQEFGKIIDKMTQFSRQNRYQVASEVLKDLNNTPTEPYQTGNPPKKNILLLTLFPLLGVGIIGYMIIPKTGDRFLNYQNQTEKFKINYPQEWQKKEGTVTGDIVKFIAPKENDGDSLAEELKITVEELENPQITLAEYSENTLQEISEHYTSEPINYTVIKLANSEAHRIIYKQDSTNNKNRKNMLVYTLKNNRAYIITYTANIDDYEKYEPIVQQMVNSLKIE